jgi:hypothetical protein
MPQTPSTVQLKARERMAGREQGRAGKRRSKSAAQHQEDAAQKDQVKECFGCEDQIAP